MMKERYYEENYSPQVARLILMFRFHRFFSSALFLAPSALFFLNLSVCAADRIVKQAKRGAPKRYGPDFIHIGVLLLMVGGLVSLSGRQEWHVRLAEGQSALLPSSHRILLTSFKRSSYPDGRPREYISRVQVFKEGSIEKTEEIRVNRPLRVNGLKIYQDSYAVTPTLFLLDESQTEHYIRQGEYFRIEETFFSFFGITPDEEGLLSTPEDRRVGQDLADSTVILIQEYDGEENPVGMRLVSPSDRINGYTIGGVLFTEQTGLRVVQDRSFALVLVGFAIIGCGLALTFIQKHGDEMP